jgi:Glyoxalase-like domain
MFRDERPLEPSGPGGFSLPEGAVVMPVWLDHASVAVPHLAAAVERLDRRLGLRATVSPAAPERHSRVYLHRSYLEVSVGPGEGGWRARMFFLRFDDPDVLRAHLEAAGIAYRWGRYEGVDGTWDDVEVRLGAAALPTLIRRTAPAEIARDWPPALAEPHRCGARSLAAVHVEVPSVAEAREAYRRLLGADLPEPERGRARVPLASGEIVLRGDGAGEIAGIVLGVASLEATRAALPEPLRETDDGVAWLDPAETHGLPLGFAELAPAG